jgi:hypothetical protein
MKKHYELHYKKGDYKPVYLVNGEKNDFVVRASPLDKAWSRPGEVFCALKDTGNGLILSFKGGRTIHLNYCEAEELRLMLKLNQPNVSLSEITKKAIR